MQLKKKILYTFSSELHPHRFLFRLIFYDKHLALAEFEHVCHNGGRKRLCFVVVISDNGVIILSCVGNILLRSLKLVVKVKKVLVCL